MNKYTLFFLFNIIFISTTIANNKSYTIRGKINNPNLTGKYLYLSTIDYTNGQVNIVDSCAIVDNQFVMKGNTSQTPSIYFLDTDSKRTSPQILFVLEPGNITIDINESHHKIDGTLKNKQLNDFQQKLESINKEYTSYIKNNEYSEKEAYEKIESAKLEAKNELYKYIKSNIKNPIGEFWLLFGGTSLDFSQIKALLKEVNPDFLKTDIGKEFAEYYTDSSFIDIIGENPNNETIKLSDYVNNNQYTLVDYWASWCGPCRKEMPNLVKIYDKYKDKGFEIVGISLDMDENSWIKSIDKMGMTWPQMSDFKGWTSELAKPYKVTSIPFTILIDRNGEIIAKRLSLQELDRILEKRLK